MSSSQKEQVVAGGDPGAAVARRGRTAVRLGTVGHGHFGVGQILHDTLGRAVRCVVHHDDLVPASRVVELDRRGKRRGERAGAPEGRHDDADRRVIVGHRRGDLSTCKLTGVLEESARVVRIVSREQILSHSGCPSMSRAGSGPLGVR